MNGVRALSLLAVLACSLALVACSSGAASPAATPTVTALQAEHQIKQAVLQPADLPAGFTQDAARAITNDQAAQARPDTQQALQQYADWGQQMLYNVSYGAKPDPSQVFNAEIAQVTNSATLFATADGAAKALDYARNLPPDTVANFLVNEGAGTQISDTQVTKEAFPAKGDDSFAWRLSGKAKFDNGFTVNFVADAIFLRVGHIDGTIVMTALGAAPERDKVEAFVDTFVRRATSAQ